MIIFQFNDKKNTSHRKNEDKSKNFYYSTNFKIKIKK